MLFQRQEGKLTVELAGEGLAAASEEEERRRWMANAFPCSSEERMMEEPRSGSFWLHPSKQLEDTNPPTWTEP